MKLNTKKKKSNANGTKKYIMIYRMDFAMELIRQGHKVVEMCPNPSNSRLVAWIFEKDANFRKDFNKLLNNE